MDSAARAFLLHSEPEATAFHCYWQPTATTRSTLPTSILSPHLTHVCPVSASASLPPCACPHRQWQVLHDDHVTRGHSMPASLLLLMVSRTRLSQAATIHRHLTGFKYSNLPANLPMMVHRSLRPHRPHHPRSQVPPVRRDFGYDRLDGL